MDDEPGRVRAAFAGPREAPGLVAQTGAGRLRASGDLIVTGADGGGTDRADLTEPIWPEEPDWSPDGTQIAFSCCDSLYIVEAAGGTARQLLSDRADGMAPGLVARRRRSHFSPAAPSG